MKLQEGVYLHFIPSTQFTTNRIQFRFTAPLSEETVAGRVLVANILENGGRDYENAQEFRRKLASLYGATLSTSVSKRGQTHIVDVTITYIKKHLIDSKKDLTESIMLLLKSVLLRPTIDKNGFSKDIFAIEKRNLLSYLEAEMEDHFYHADKELNQLYYQDNRMKLPRVGTVELLEKETEISTYTIYKNMLKLDRIDITVLGEVDERIIQKELEEFHFSYRNPILETSYKQPLSKITKEKIERKAVNQSILELAFGLQVVYSSVDYPALLVLNALLGDSPHSRLFVTIREKEGAAYTIGSSLHIFSGMLRIYAGIDKNDRLSVIQLIQKELKQLKRGRLTEKEIEWTKKSLLRSYYLSQDRQGDLIDECYRQSIDGSEAPSGSQLVESIQKVGVEDVVAVSKKMKLQALYFMEGTLENE